MKITRRENNGTERIMHQGLCRKQALMTLERSRSLHADLGDKWVYSDNNHEMVLTCYGGRTVTEYRAVG